MNKKYVLILSAASLLVMISAHSRPVNRPDMSHVDFVKECTTSSDPSNRLLYAHEQVVNSFLDVPRKFGRQRMPVMHLGNEHLATHGGTTESPGAWNENGHHYQLENDWGMIGDIAEDKPKVYLLKVSTLLRRPSSAKKDEAKVENPSSLPVPSERDVDPFEVYAISMLKKGEAVVRWERDGLMRGVGAIRSSASCQRCHETKDGELLGAFTYEFGAYTTPEPPQEMNLAVQYAREGHSLKQIGQLMKEYKKNDTAASKVPAQQWEWLARGWLLENGMVPTEAVHDQTVRREFLLQWIQSSFNRPTKTTAKN